jgi:hypothetical protein
VVNYDISNGKVVGSEPPNSLLADAGADQTVNANKKGTARVSLDGSGGGPGGGSCGKEKKPPCP